MVTFVPGCPLAGVKEVILGAPQKEPLLVAGPAGVVTVMGPLLALFGTRTERLELPDTVKKAGTPLKLTLEVSRKFSPVIVRGVPGEPLFGVNPVMRAGK